MTPRLRKLNLVAHVTTSVGWLGAVVAFLALSIAGLASHDIETVRGAYLAMDLLGRYVVVPLSLLALASGLAQALGTEWGLFRYHWVVVKLVLTFGSVFLLLLHQYVAVAAAARAVSASAAGTWPEVGRWAPQLVKDAALATVTLVAITAISIFKPWGRTRYARSLTAPPAPVASDLIPARDSLPARRSLRRMGLVLLVIVVAAILIGLHVHSHFSSRH